jgi:glycosyltransferase involved in cell wall biosynthesis
MKVLLIVDDYLPHSIKVAAKMMHDLALEMMSYGHEVIVVTPRPQQVEKLVVSDYEGVKVLYFKSGEIKNVDMLTRLLNEMSLSTRAWRFIDWNKELPSLDLIVSYSPSIFWGSLVKKLKAKYEVPVYLVLRDFFPQWVIDQGVIGYNSPKAIFLRYFEKRNYLVADRIGMMSAKSVEFFEKNIYQGHASLEVLPNWSRAQKHVVSENLKSVLGLEEKVVFFYGGVIGQAQSIEYLVNLAIDLKHLKSCHFLFLGNGDHEELVINAAREHENISYHSSVTQDKYLDFLAASDVGMFCLSPEHKSHNFPGKLLGYMEAQLPVLGIVNKENDLIELVNVNDGGMIFDHNNKEAFYEAALRLATDAPFRISLGRSGNEFLKKFFSAERAVDSILALERDFS